MSEWNLGGLVVGSVSGFIAAWVVMLVSRPRGLEHPLFFPMAIAAIMIGLLSFYLTFDADAVVAAFSRRETQSASQLFLFSAGLAHTIVCGIALSAWGIVDMVRIVRSRRE
jgi:F0F1-type ATP synthase membrane subunit c/vacuolar-type H+-ATPase subunit K